MQDGSLFWPTIIQIKMALDILRFVMTSDGRFIIISHMRQSVVYTL